MSGVKRRPRGRRRRGRRCTNRTQGGGEGPVVSKRWRLQGGGGRRHLNPDPGRRKGRVSVNYLPQAASVAIRVIMLR